MSDERYSDEVERLLELSKLLEQMSEVLLEQAKHHGTREQWGAVNDLRAASRYVHSAGGWLERHDAKLGTSLGTEPLGTASLGTPPPAPLEHHTVLASEEDSALWCWVCGNHMRSYDNPHTYHHATCPLRYEFHESASDWAAACIHAEGCGEDVHERCCPTCTPGPVPDVLPPEPGAF